MAHPAKNSLAFIKSVSDRKLFLKDEKDFSETDKTRLQQLRNSTNGRLEFVPDSKRVHKLEHAVAPVKQDPEHLKKIEEMARSERRARRAAQKASLRLTLDVSKLRVRDDPVRFEKDSEGQPTERAREFAEARRSAQIRRNAAIKGEQIREGIIYSLVHNPDTLFELF